MVAVFFVCTYIASFAFSLGPIVWVIVSEIFPTKVRGRAISVATMVNWGANFIVGLTFLVLIDELHTWGTFWLFGSLSILSLWYIRAKVPETKGKTLEEIEQSWLPADDPRRTSDA
ncbi:MAG: MFS transporter [Acidimicrobiia bacterium]|nr:MFS transporter [Acidimicrobiia bacterium]